MIDVLAETLQKLTARRGLLAREISTLDEAIAALHRVRDEAPKHGPAAARSGPVCALPPRSSPAPGPPDAPPAPRLCALKICGKLLPPPVRATGRPRIYCNDGCARRAADQRKAGPIAPPPSTRTPSPLPPRLSKKADEDDREDPTDRALRRHRELHRLPESGSGYRDRARGARS